MPRDDASCTAPTPSPSGHPGPAKTEGGSAVARVCFVFAALVPSLSCMPFACAPSWGNVITDYGVVRPDGRTNSFGGTITDDELEAVRNFRGSFSPAAWIIREIEPQSDYMAQSLHDAGERYALNEMSSVLSHRDGFCHVVGLNRLCYERDLIDAIDLYRAFLVLKGPDDEEIWRTRVPFMRMPVYPYVVGRYAIYVAWKSLLSSQIVIVDISRGTVVDRWPIPGWDDFTPMAPVETYPYFTDGHIVVQGSKAVSPEPNTDEEFRYVPQEIYVLKTRIESPGD